jgi:hypothetical protein
MKEDRTPKRIFTQELEGTRRRGRPRKRWIEEVGDLQVMGMKELEGTRRRGRPRKRWIEEVEGDLQVMGMKRWRTMAISRKKWKDIV